MKEILKFVRDLTQNNNREWFNANKPRYQAVLKQWHDFCLKLIAEIGSFDPDIAKLTIADCTYRIYRDTRFSPDKTPYKTHFGVFLCPGGKKSMHAGYYFHLGTGLSDSYPHAHMLASGNYCYEPAVIPILREDISDGWEETDDINELQKRANNCAVVHTQRFIEEVKSGKYPVPDIFAFAMGTNDAIEFLGDPEKALEYYKDSHVTGGEFCTMCGPNFCAMRISHRLTEACEENKHSIL